MENQIELQSGLLAMCFFVLAGVIGVLLVFLYLTLRRTPAASSELTSELLRVQGGAFSLGYNTGENVGRQNARAEHILSAPVDVNQVEKLNMMKNMAGPKPDDNAPGQVEVGTNREY